MASSRGDTCFLAAVHTQEDPAGSSEDGVLPHARSQHAHVAAFNTQVVWLMKEEPVAEED